MTDARLSLRRLAHGLRGVDAVRGEAGGGEARLQKAALLFAFISVLAASAWIIADGQMTR